MADEPGNLSAVRISGVNYLGDLPTLIADKRNFFGNNNLQASLSYVQSGKKNLQRLRNGEIDFALMALTPIVLDYISDASPGQADDPVILANLVHSGELNYVVSGVNRTVGDMTGDRVALSMGTNSEVQWWLFAETNRIDPLAVQLIDMAPEESVLALLQGEVDTAVLWEPWYSRLQSQAGGRFQPMPFSDIHTAKWVIVTSRQIAAERPDLCLSVLAAYQQSIEYIERNHRSVMAEYSLFTDLDMFNDKAITILPDYHFSLDWSLIAFLQQQFDWAVRAGYAPRERTWDILSLINDRYLKALMPSRIGIPIPIDEKKQ